MFSLDPMKTLRRMLWTLSFLLAVAARAAAAPPSPESVLGFRPGADRQLADWTQIVDSLLKTNGAEYDKLYVPGTGFKRRPYTDPEQFQRGEHIPVMDGRAVFKMATTNMIAVAQEVLARNEVRIDDVSLVLMHQANKRINEYCQKALGIPDSKVLHNIERYGNTTAATIPLLWDEAARAEKINPGDLVLLVAFGAGMNWGATLVRA